MFSIRITFFILFMVAAYLFGLAAAVFVNHRNINKRGFKGIPYKKCFNPFFIVGVFVSLVLDKVFSDDFIEGFYKHFAITIYGKPRYFNFRYSLVEYFFPRHILHQFALRYFHPICTVCISRRTCPQGNCGCDARAKAFSMNEKCSGGQFRVMVSRKEFAETPRLLINVMKVYKKLIK